MTEQLHILGVNNISSDNNVICKNNQAIDQQMNDWKGSRWWRFHDKNAYDSWSEWFNNAMCWQDQNEHKPLAKFWCLIFDELIQVIYLFFIFLSVSMIFESV